MADMEVSLHDLVEAYRAVKPRAVPTLTSIIKTIALPAWRSRRRGTLPLAARMQEIPAHQLYALLEGTTATWRPEVGRTLPPGKSYQAAYPRALRRLMSFGEDRGILHPDQFAIAPAWRTLLKEVDGVPSRHVDGATARWAFRRLARWATAANLMPQSIPATGKDGRIMGDFRATFPIDGDGGFYQARRIWNALAEHRPELLLAAWPAEPRDDLSALPRTDWPAAITNGFLALLHRDGLGAWKAETKQGYALRIGSYMGVLLHIGFDPRVMLVGVTDGTAAMRLLFQGLGQVPDSGVNRVESFQGGDQAAVGSGSSAAAEGSVGLKAG